MSSIDDLPIRPDKPKRFVLSQHAGIVISIIALAVSITSLVQSYRNSALQNELARPIFESFEDARMVEIQNANGRATYDLQIGIKNAGHLTAFVTDVAVRPAIAGFDDTSSFPCVKDLIRLEARPRSSEEKEVPPDHMEWFYLNIEVPDSCRTFHSGFPITVALIYHDRIHLTPYNQTVQMRAPMTHEH